MAEESTEELALPKSKKGLIIGVAGAAVVAVGAVLFFTGAFSSSGGAKPAVEPVDVTSGPDLGPPITLKAFVVNIEDGEKSLYLKTTLAVEVTSESARTIFEKSNMQVRNEILMYLSSLKPDETKGIKNKKALQETLRKQINERLESKVVKGVYFTEFVTQ